MWGAFPMALWHATSATDHLGSVGLVRGRLAPTVLYNPEWECRLVVHGDDFTFLCPRCR